MIAVAMASVFFSDFFSAAGMVQLSTVGLSGGWFALTSEPQ
jgi:membrane associated rhomboid family serine protease